MRGFRQSSPQHDDGFRTGCKKGSHIAPQKQAAKKASKTSFFSNLLPRLRLGKSKYERWAQISMHKLFITTIKEAKESFLHTNGLFQFSNQVNISCKEKKYVHMCKKSNQWREMVLNFLIGHKLFGLSSTQVKKLSKRKFSSLNS